MILITSNLVFIHAIILTTNTMNLYTPAGFYLLRMPLLPIERLMSLNNKVLSEDSYSLNLEMKNIFSNSLLLESIFIVSPPLYLELRKWLDDDKLDDDKENIKRIHKLILTLYKYYTRMTTRCTPFGLFAGCSGGEFGEKTNIRFENNNRVYKYSRLDMNYVGQLTQLLTSRKDIRGQLKFYRNSSLYQIGKEYRYVEYKIKDKKRFYFISSVKVSQYLKDILLKAKDGSLLDDLVSTIQKDDISYEEASLFINELIDSQFLVSELEPTVTGTEFYEILIEKLSLLSNTEIIVSQLRNVSTLLRQQDNNVDKYLKIEQIIKDSFINTDNKNLIQTDLFYRMNSNEIGNKVINKIKNDLNNLFVFVKQNQSADISNFKKNFYQRYEEQEIPLSVALDCEIGVGYAVTSGNASDNTPLISKLTLQKAKQELNINWGKVEKFKLNKYLDSLVKTSSVIQITDEEVDTLKEKGEEIHIPDSFYLFGSLLARSKENLDEGDFKFNVSTIHGPSGGNLIARFCHGSEFLSTRVRNLMDIESQGNPEVIYAEVAHLPESRIGNILMRPNLRQYEIPFLTGSSLSKEFQIPIEDLMISVKNGKGIRLRSKKLNKEIVPRLTTAHNFQNGLPMYKFLCDLQSYQLNSTFYWDWGILSAQTFLPRVEYKNFIISRARWKIMKTDFYNFNKNLEDSEITAQVKGIRQKFKVPQYVVVTEGDNELLIDLENTFGLRIFYDTLIKKGSVLLTEFLSTPNNCFIKDENGHYTNELIIPFNKIKGEAPNTHSSPHKEECQPINKKRNFMTGSEWLYLKIYTGTKTTDKILVDCIQPLVTELISNGIIDKWFFIRYNVPENHLRIRFHSADHNLFWQTVLAKLQFRLEPYLNEGIIHNIQTDIYKKEIERYGTATMELSEEIFYRDSQAIVEIISLFEGDEGERYRWLLALRGLDMLLNDFRLDLPGKASIMKRLQGSYFSEFRGNKILKKQLDDSYRSESKEIDSFFDSEKDIENCIEEAVMIFQTRSMFIREIVDEIHKIQQISSNKGISLDTLILSYAHMFLNRLFISNQRMHELVVYHFLNKYYTSLIAREAMVAK